MNNKLKLEDLAPYLPYGLKCEILDYQSDYVGKKYLTMKGYYLLNDKPYFNFHNGRDYAGKNTTQFKPILRPLSDLELDEFNNKIFNREYIVCEGVDADLGYYEWCYLLEEHFDIFGLIEKGLAIDINTL